MLKHLLHEEVVGTLIVPVWKLSTLWSMLTDKRCGWIIKNNIISNEGQTYSNLVIVHWLFIAQLDLNICPAEFTGLYLSSTETQPSSKEYFFRAVTYFKNSFKHKLRKQNSPISYSSVLTT